MRGTPCQTPARQSPQTTASRKPHPRRGLQSGRRARRSPATPARPRRPPVAPPARPQTSRKALRPATRPPSRGRQATRPHRAPVATRSVRPPTAASASTAALEDSGQATFPKCPPEPLDEGGRGRLPQPSGTIASAPTARSSTHVSPRFWPGGRRSGCLPCRGSAPSPMIDAHAAWRKPWHRLPGIEWPATSPLNTFHGVRRLPTRR